MQQLVMLLYQVLAAIIGLLLVIAGTGLFTGSACVVYSFRYVLSRIHTADDRYEGMLAALFIPQPAYTMYVFGRGWRFSEIFVPYLFNALNHSKNKWIASATLVRYIASTSPRLLRWLIKPMSWLFTVGAYAAPIMQWLAALITAALLLALHILFLYVCWLSALSTIGILRALSALKRKMGGASLHCPSCYNEVVMPSYLCAGCATSHTRLLPGPYGVFSHRCIACGTYLPTLDLFGRRKLERLCNHCHYPLQCALGQGNNLHIAIVGGVSAGKTSYMTIALHALIQAFMAQGQHNFTWIDPEQEKHFLTNLALLTRGRKLPATTDLTPLPLMLQMHSPKHRKPALIHIYDPAGAAFHSIEQFGRQHYYSFTNGIIFIIDASTLLTNHQTGRVSAEQATTSADLATMQIYERMISTIEASSGVNARQRYTQPIAVIVTNADLHLFKDEPVPSAIHALMQGDSTLTQSEVTNCVVRNFLCSHGLDNLLHDLEAHFTSVGYFSCLVQLQPPRSVDPANTMTERILAPLAWLLEHY